MHRIKARQRKKSLAVTPSLSESCPLCQDAPRWHEHLGLHYTLRPSCIWARRALVRSRYHSNIIIKEEKKRG